MANRSPHPAADLLESKEWIQGSMCRYSGAGEEVGYCALGAVDRAYGDSGEVWRANARLRLQIGSNYIGSWNDAPGRTKQEVLEAMRTAGV